jgi:hypothetical protein
LTVTPKDFAPNRYWRDQSVVAILQVPRGDLSEPQRRFRRELFQIVQRLADFVSANRSCNVVTHHA